ncbi:MAG: beta-lactamase family protein [Gemmatimonadetes bacterium]|nr:beta-lactamase family protein [Gemmatimonadota bacterium]
MERTIVRAAGRRTGALCRGGAAATLLLAASCASSRGGLPSAPPVELGLSPSALAAIAPAMQAYVDSGRLAGVTALIVRNGRIGYEQSFGWQDVERGVPLREAAVYRIFSMTKPVVAAGVLRLIDQGKLSLEDPVSKYIPSFAGVQVYAGGGADAPILQAPDSVLTIRHLLTHTAGLGYGIGTSPLDTIYQRAALFDASRTVEQFADSIARLPLYFSPGTRFLYSASIDVIGRVIEVASGMPLDRFLHEELFRPLDMRDTSFRRRADMDGRLVTLYSQDPEGGLREVTGGLDAMYRPDARFFWGGGGLLSTTHDYLRFALMLRNGGELNGRRVLSRESVALMMRDHLPSSLSPLGTPPMVDGGYGYGLAGAVLVDSSRSELPGAEGIYRWSGYVGTYFWIDPANDLIGMVWAQFTPGRTWDLEQEFQRLVYAAVQSRPEGQR